MTELNQANASYDHLAAFPAEDLTPSIELDMEGFLLDCELDDAFDNLQSGEFIAVEVAR